MKNTKWQLKILESHSRSKITELEQVYKTYSTDKRKIYNLISYEFRNDFSHGHICHMDLRIITYNTHQFTCGYYYTTYYGQKYHTYFKYFSYRRTVEFEVFEQKYLQPQKR